MGRSSRDSHDQDDNQNTLLFALGAAGGLALGYLLSKGIPAAPEPVREAGARLRDAARGFSPPEPVRQGAARLRERAMDAARGWQTPQPVRDAGARLRDAARSWGPGRMRRGERETQALGATEDAVIDAFLRDSVLSERGIDVGCISRGIIELSGTVHTAEEAERAVRVARAVDGVETVVNRMDVDDDGHRHQDPEWEGRMAGEWTGRNVGMGQRRQGEQTDPGADDSQHQREMALEQADRAQYEDEDLAHSRPLVGSRPGTGDANPTRYREDELDNQDPYGKHAVPTPEQPQAMHSHSRVGEGLKPGTELALEGSDVPVKPHSEDWHGTDGQAHHTH